MLSLKFVAVGYGGMGKTCMLIRYFRKEFPEIFVPTVLENEYRDVEFDGEMYNMTCWKAPGGHAPGDYDRLRPLSYLDTDAFLLLHAVNCKNNFDDIETYWWPELKHHCPGVPVILVGSKVDLRDENSLSFEEGRQMAEKIGAACYMECSALSGEGVNEIFVQGVELSLFYINNLHRKKCIIL